MPAAETEAQPFNLVVIVEPHHASAVRRGLEAHASLRPTPYRGVLVGRVPEPAATWLDAEWRRAPESFADVVRVTPLERVAVFERDDVTETLCEMLEAEAGRLCGRTFHVRARLRGLTGRLHAQAVERALGAFLVESSGRVGAPAEVRFDDPDVVVAVEVVERWVGYGVLDRDVRSLPLVRTR